MAFQTTKPATGWRCQARTVVRYELTKVNLAAPSIRDSQTYQIFASRSDAATLARTATVMRHRRHVANGCDREPDSLKGTQSALTP